MSIPTIEDLIPHAQRFYIDNGRWPWTTIGVFGVDPDERADYTDFCYTIGAATGPYNSEYWCPCFSIENRYLEPGIVTSVLNIVIASIAEAVLGTGDSVIVPLGIPGEDGEWDHDANAVFWIGGPVDDESNLLMTNMTPVDRIIPIKWSSPLGWRE